MLICPGLKHLVKKVFTMLTMEVLLKRFKEKGISPESGGLELNDSLYKQRPLPIDPTRSFLSVCSKLVGVLRRDSQTSFQRADASW